MHSHSHRGNTGGVLKWSFFATTLFVVLEFAAGIQAHSLALVSDAGHNLTDALALLLAWLAHYLQSKPPDEAKTYGYHRAGVLAAFVNALVLVGLSVWIFWESYHRLLRPRAVDETVMLAVAAGGLLLNGAIMWGLRPASRRDLKGIVRIQASALCHFSLRISTRRVRASLWIAAQSNAILAVVGSSDGRISRPSDTLKPIM